jgi:hypothetical protein
METIFHSFMGVLKTLPDAFLGYFKHFGVSMISGPKRCLLDFA